MVKLARARRGEHRTLADFSACPLRVAVTCTVVLVSHVLVWVGGWGCGARYRTSIITWLRFVAGSFVVVARLTVITASNAPDLLCTLNGKVGTFGFSCCRLHRFEGRGVWVWVGSDPLPPPLPKKRANFLAVWRRGVRRREMKKKTKIYFLKISIVQKCKKSKKKKGEKQITKIKKK